MNATYRIVALAIVLLMLTSHAAMSKMFQIALSCDESSRVTYTINDKQIDEKKLVEIIGKLAKMAPDLQAQVISTERASASELTRLLHIIQSNGLHNVVLITRGREKGKAGYFSISVDVAKRPIGTCIAGTEMASGFHGEGDQDGEIREVLEKQRK